jgi:hypothetical protein
MRGFIPVLQSVALATFQLSGEKLDEIRAATEGGNRYLPAFSVTITDPQGRPITRVDKLLYVRRKRAATAQRTVA